MRLDRVSLSGPRVLEGLEDAGEPGLAATINGREVGPGIEGPTVRGGEDSHRPASVTGGRLSGRHIEAVEVWTLLPVDLDGNEGSVGDCRDGRILETLVRHHMAPVARGIPDRDQQRPIELGCVGQGLVVPRLPGNGIVRMLQEIGAG